MQAVQTDRANYAGLMARLIYTWLNTWYVIDRSLIIRTITLLLCPIFHLI